MLVDLTEEEVSLIYKILDAAYEHDIPSWGDVFDDVDKADEAIESHLALIRMFKDMPYEESLLSDVRE